MWLAGRDADVSWEDKDYTYLDFYRKSYEYENEPLKKTAFFNQWREAIARREYHTGSIRPINHLIQFDKKPNIEVKEARWEIYKISVSFEYKG